MRHRVTPTEDNSYSKKWKQNLTFYETVRDTEPKANKHDDYSWDGRGRRGKKRAQQDQGKLGEP